ncbi:peptidoglycan recognition protein family protein [Streptomyces odontomachi]|uniref:peptidoglycan recognition protein family protein n=1 Tax=Streptomyces odontomachi TaxID=2944940 RepID=UPI00210DACD2|nr:N-acetylmuramoyl-L-alanine amidase [Streptomyces sp. ODS25]
MTPALPRRAFLAGAVAIGVGTGFEVLSVTPAHAAPGTPEIFDCTAWNARPPTSAVSLAGNNPNKILVHHTDFPNTPDATQADSFAIAKEIQDLHIDHNGWIDSGQHFTISRSGVIMEGRHRSLERLKAGSNMVVGAHCPGQNSSAIGIENNGTYMTEAPPAVLYGALTGMCAYICWQYGLSASEIYGHRDFLSTTDCPGDVLYGMLPQLRLDVAAEVDPGGRVWPSLGQGTDGENVRALQYLLTQTGRSLGVDGDFGPATASAVEDFQKAAGLTVDGVAGATTWELLVPPRRNGSSGAAVTAAQRLLNLHGSSLTADGVFGSLTASAVKAFQTAGGLPADGVVASNTWSRLLATP